MRQRGSDWHISGWPAIMLAPFLFPIALLFQLLPVKKTKDRTAEEVSGFLANFLIGAGGAWDWDDFTSIPITTPELDAIRIDAERIDLPLTEVGKLKLQELMERTEALKASVSERQ